MNRFMLVSVLLLLLSACSQQQNYRKPTSIPNVESHTSTSEACKTYVAYEEEKRLLAAIPEESKACAGATVQEIEKVKHAAEVAFECGQKETYEKERILGRDSSLARLYIEPNLTLSTRPKVI